MKKGDGSPKLNNSTSNYSSFLKSIGKHTEMYYNINLSLPSQNRTVHFGMICDQSLLALFTFKIKSPNHKIF